MPYESVCGCCCCQKQSTTCIPYAHNAQCTLKIVVDFVNTNNFRHMSKLQWITSFCIMVLHSLLTHCTSIWTDARRTKQNKNTKLSIVQRIKVSSSAHFMCIKMLSQCTNQIIKKKKKKKNDSVWKWKNEKTNEQQVRIVVSNNTENDTLLWWFN